MHRNSVREVVQFQLLPERNGIGRTAALGCCVRATPQCADYVHTLRIRLIAPRQCKEGSFALAYPLSRQLSASIGIEWEEAAGRLPRG